MASSVVRKSRTGNETWLTVPERRLNARKTGAGYLAVQSKDNGRRMTLYIHRLVAEAFLPKPQHCNEVNHIDGDKTNNSLQNLEWTTHSLNLRHAYANSLCRRSLSPEEALQVKVRLSAGASPSELAAVFGVSKSAIRAIQAGRSWAWLSGIPSTPQV